uniref:RAD51 paralog D n=1 Tax=Cyprinus carpio carpio TaxID=630221 RepID=A0A9J8AX04_CYPCA
VSLLHNCLCPCNNTCIILSVEDFVSCNPKELAQKCSLSYKAVVAVRRVLLAQYTAFAISGADLYEELWSSTAILSTGNTSLDKLLDSGLYIGEITELTGSPGSGKTQVCFSVAVNICHQLKQTVFYIDTKGGMCANRLLQTLQSNPPNMEEQVMSALQKIKVFRVFDNGLQKVTNCVTKYGNGHLKAGLGQSWSHVPHTRVLLQRIEGAETSSLRTATLTKSSRQACHLVEEFDLCHWSEERRTSISGKRKLEERSKP